MMTHVAFFLKDTEKGTDGRITRRCGKGGEDFGSGGLTPGMENIHDLAFAAAEMVIGIHFVLLKY